MPAYSKEFEAKLREEYKKYLASWISKLIKMHYLKYGNKFKNSYEQMYSLAQESFNLSEKDKDEVYRNVNRLLTSREQIFMANDNRKKPMFIISSIGKPRFML